MHGWRMMSSIRACHRFWSLLGMGAPTIWGACVYDWTRPTQSDCARDVPCAENEYCAYPDHRCGDGDRGICLPRPGECLAGELRVVVCGCGQETHDNAC